MRSGHCCKQAPCPFGTWDPIKKQCAHLIVDRVLAPGVEQHACGIYAEIVGKPGAEISPAFGAGCCQPLFNEARSKIISVTVSSKRST